ncbi:MAG: RNA polymerase-associated protein RapA [Xanthomonadales bacterium]|nr:RNA polymerase-associated protein RapA [Xanthomonadales bacterium]
MPSIAFQPGQRWVSNTESELGLGIVLEVAHRRVEMNFPAADEKRVYAIDNAPLSRVRYEVGQKISNLDDHELLISEVAEHNGCLIYLGSDDDGQVMIVPELELNSFVQFSNPQDRLFAGQIDKNKAFELRLETLRHYRRLQQSPVSGLLGARIQLLPHQLYIANEIASRYAPRVLLADEVGLGKTIEAGLIIHQQLITGRASRVLIAVPDSLIHQWLVEMLRRFNLFFTIVDEERCLALLESGTENPFESAQLVLCSLSFLSEQQSRLKQAEAAEWDLLVVDEAHHLEWTEESVSPAYQAIETLSQRARGLLLLTATPEQLGIEGHFARLRLLDPARYFSMESFLDEEARYAPVNELVQRLLADDGLKQFASKPVQKQLSVFLGKPALTALNIELESNESDPENILTRLIRELLDRHGTGRVLFRNTRASVEGFPQRELHQHLLPESAALDPDTAAGPAELEARLKPELGMGEQWLKHDARVNWLVDFLEQQRGKKILVICARAETALELEQYLNLKQGIHSAVFHEGLSLIARDRAAAYFADDEQGAQVLVCSEIGSEGRNFQFSNQLVLFDLPLNPDLLEQRIGRLDRIGQRHTVLIHVPFYQNSAQQVLLRWYHEGINAFESTCAVGQTLFLEFEEALENCLLQPGDTTRVDDLINQTRKRSEALIKTLQLGRDRLLELNSCDNEQAERIIEDMHGYEHRRTLSNYMETVFDQFGVDQEHHSANSVVLRPGEHMTEHSFPALPEEGLTATFHRDQALAREDFHYLTWEHPMVTGAMDMVLSGDFGNTAFCTMKLAPLKAGAILLEAIFTTVCPAPSALQLHRYLPLTTTRIVVDIKGNDLSELLTEKHFNKLGQRVRLISAQDFLRHTRAKIVSMLKKAEQLAADQEPSIVDAAKTHMQKLQQTELRRLQALAEVNPNIRQEEIDYLVAETSELEHHLDSTHLKLEALRVAVITE